MHYFGKRKKIIFLIALLIPIIAGGVFCFLKYQEIFAADVFLVKDRSLNPDDAVEIIFSQPMLTEITQKSINIEPKADVNFFWNDKNKRLTIIPISLWTYGSSYKISLKGRSAYMTNSTKDLFFETAPGPSVKSFFPLNKEKDVSLDMENPIVANFENLNKKWDVKFVVDPANNLAYSRDEEKQQIRLMPRVDLAEGEKYFIKVYVKYSKQASQEYRQIYETFFETKKTLPSEKWDRDPQVKLQQAKENTKPQLTSGKYIDINLKQQIMVIFEDGKALDAYLISSGKRGMETEEGTFAICNKAEKPWSKKYSLFMPYWMALVPSGEFGIHELPEWPGGYKEGANHLGTPVSHGCVRLGVGSAKRVYEWAQIGTPVVIHG